MRTLILCPRIGSVLINEVVSLGDVESDTCAVASFLLFALGILDFDVGSIFM